VQVCQHTGCTLHPFRSGQGKQNARNRDRAIKAYCRWCANSFGEVLHCPVTTCPLYPFRKFRVEHPARIPGFSHERPYTRQLETSMMEGIPMEALK